MPARPVDAIAGACNKCKLSSHFELFTLDSLFPVGIYNKCEIMSHKELEKGRIIPDVIDKANVHSKAQIAVTYGDIPVILGENIAPKDVSRALWVRGP